ncbi:Hypothetical predicted protein [Octopus vulgaris]|uniref:Uncharacterized protein n=1 Tax=Octopus vulgaris TaxID=6645 RepID=A0AA36AIZ2_OCTVU|nr:Hypothetical predicted protein [Octopus vulgaris]
MNALTSSTNLAILFSHTVFNDDELNNRSATIHRKFHTHRMLAPRLPKKVFFSKLYHSKHSHNDMDNRYKIILNA